MAFPISQIDFNSYSISISSDKDSGLSAIVIYGQDDEDDGESKKKKRRKQSIRLGTLCSHFLKLFLVQFSQSRPFQSHINMSLFNGFQGKIRDGLKLSMAKIIENFMTVHSDLSHNFVSRINLYHGDAVVYPSSSSSSAGVKDLQLSTQIESLISETQDSLTLWGCDGTHRSSNNSARRMSNAKGSKSAKLCDIHFAMQDGSRRVVWIRSLPPSPFVLVLVVHSVSQSIRERKLVSYLCERLLTASIIYNQEKI